MIITICAVFVIAKIKRLSIKPFFRSWTVYPALLAQIVLIYAQFSVFLGSYSLIRYASFIKSACLFTFIIPIVYFRLFKPALIGSGLIISGTVLNKLVIGANGGKMPVFPSLSYLTGYVKPDMFIKAQDNIHILGDQSTKWKILSDYIDVGFSILSPGDILIHSFVFIILYQVIKTANRKNIKQNSERF
jgi:hypothetical protein